MLENFISPIAPMFGRRAMEAAADLYGTIATPAKNIATMFGFQPENHTPPAPMFATRTPEYQWNLGMMKDLQREGNIPAAMDYAGRVQGARDQQERNVQEAALGFAGTIGPGKPIRAYHGSPHDFDKFDLSKIGTGEGAQAYGHGLYFAEREGVAKSYKNALAGNVAYQGQPKSALNITDATSIPVHNVLNKMSAGATVEQAVASTRAEIQRNITALETNLANANVSPAAKAYNRDRLESYRAGLRAMDDLKPADFTSPGRMYEVNIAAKPEQFLDWDKPLGAQTVASDVSQMWRKSPTLPGSGLDLTGGEIYKALTASSPYRDKSSFVAGRLENAGIPGIKYLDQGSRGRSTWQVTHPSGGVNDFADEAAARAFLKRNPESTLKPPDQTSNYVLFRDDIIDIVRKYGFIPPMFGRRPEDK